MKKLKAIPHFKNEEEEREFWANNTSMEYIDWSKAKVVEFPNLKLTQKSITLRLPETMLHDLKSLASRQDVPYQSLMKMYLSDRIQSELHKYWPEPNKQRRKIKRQERRLKSASV